MTHSQALVPGFANEFQGITYVKSEHSSWYWVVLAACRTRFQLTQVSLSCMNGALLYQSPHALPLPPVHAHIWGCFLYADVRL